MMVGTWHQTLWTYPFTCSPSSWLKRNARWHKYFRLWIVQLAHQEFSIPQLLKNNLLWLSCPDEYYLTQLEGVTKNVRKSTGLVKKLAQVWSIFQYPQPPGDQSQSFSYSFPYLLTLRSEPWPHPFKKVCAQYELKPLEDRTVCRELCIYCFQCVMNLKKTGMQVRGSLYYLSHL